MRTVWEADPALVRRYLIGTRKLAKCPICGGTDRDIPKELVIAPRYGLPPEYIDAALGLRALQLVCTTCGHVHLVRSHPDWEVERQIPFMPDPYPPADPGLREV